MIARKIACPVAPTPSEMTLDNWTFIWAKAFCIGWMGLVSQQHVALAHDGAQGTDRLLGPERPGQQAKAHQLLQPLAVEHVTLAAGDVLDVPGVDPIHRETARLQ